jgi:predicted nucleotidyltransferase
MLYGLNSTQLTLLNKLAINPLHKHVCELYIWGPRAQYAPDKNADIDIMIESELGIPGTEKILQAIKESSLGLDVNLYYPSEFSKDFLQNIVLEKIHIPR